MLRDDLNRHPENLFKYIQKQPFKQYVLIDEIQYLKDPSNFLKFHYDFNSETIKLIVSGSSAFYIDQKFNDSLAGRKKIFNLYPFSFSEFLEELGNSFIKKDITEAGVRNEDKFFNPTSPLSR